MAELLVVKEKLRQLRESADWDASMQSTMDFWEKQIAWAEENEESFYRLPKIVEMAGMLQARREAINRELGTNRKLSENARQLLFIERDILDVQISIFGYSDFLEGVEKQIDFEADVFKDKPGTDDEDDLT